MLASTRVQPLLRIAGLAVGALVGLGAVAAVAAVVAPARTPDHAALVVARADGLHVVQPNVRDARLAGTRGARSPSWAPNGRELAFERAGGVYVINRDGSGLRLLLPGKDPDWSPDGRFVIAAQKGAIVVVRRNGHGAKRITSGPNDAQPAWSPDGTRVAFSRNGAVIVARASGAGAAVVADGTAPSWSPDSSTLAFVSAGGIASLRLADGQLLLHTIDAEHRAPSFSVVGSEIVFASNGTLYAVARDGGAPRPIGPGSAAEWARVPAGRELLPDLEQRAPSHLLVSHTGGRYRLGFASATDNIGMGPLWVRGVRRGPDMAGLQLVRISSGRREIHRGAGTLRYTASPTHSHWHLLNFQRYELRRAASFAFVVRDRKTGFCLGDHYGHARGVRPVPPVFVGNCGEGNHALATVDQGSSRGYTDRYSAHVHGQDLDLTGVPGGVYLVIHTANPDRLLREHRYDNNAASVRIRLIRNRGGPPSVRVLRTCDGTARC